MLSVLAAVLSVPLIVPAQQIVTDMTPGQIAEAIKAGEKGDVADGVMMKSSGFSWGSIHVATFSTPFMRVAMGPKQAKKAYREFAAADVTPKMLAPELQEWHE